MTTPQSKADVLAAFAAARAAHEAFLASIPPARLTEPGANGPWSVRDVIAHVHGWRMRTLARVDAASRGLPPPPPPWPAELEAGGDDAINAWLYEATREKPLEAVMADWHDSFDRLAAGLAALPEADLFDPQRFPMLEGTAMAVPAANGFLGHFQQEHEPDIRAWLARTPA